MLILKKDAVLNFPHSFKLSLKQMFVKLISIKRKRPTGLEVIKIYQNTEQLVTVNKLKNALNIADHVI